MYIQIMQISNTQGQLNYFNILLSLLCSLASKNSKQDFVIYGIQIGTSLCSKSWIIHELLNVDFYFHYIILIL